MTSALMAYALVVGTLMAVGAMGAEAVLRLLGFPGRWAWAGALALTLALVALAPVRTSAPMSASPGFPVVPHIGMEDLPRTPIEVTSELDTEPLGVSEIDFVVSLRRSLAAVGSAVPRHLEPFLAIFWGASTLALLLVIAAIHLQTRRLLSNLPAIDIDDLWVRVSSRLGPAAIGIGRGQIVVPQWFFDLEPRERHVVLAHEAEHVRARDPLLLAFGWVGATALAWNPVVWWMLSRLRLAVELDCDARVLRRGIDLRTYGSVLIGLVGRSPRVSPGTIALIRRPSQLERRLRTMTTQRAQYAAARKLALSSAASVAIVAACALEPHTVAIKPERVVITVKGTEEQFPQRLAEDENTIRGPHATGVAPQISSVGQGKEIAGSNATGSIVGSQSELSTLDTDARAEMAGVVSDVLKAPHPAALAEPGYSVDQDVYRPDHSAQARVFTVESPASGRRIQIVLEGDGSDDPSAVRVSGSFSREGKTLVAVTPFRLEVQTSKPLKATLSISGPVRDVKGDQIQVETQPEGQKERAIGTRVQLRREQAGDDIVMRGWNVVELSGRVQISAGAINR